MAVRAAQAAQKQASRHVRHALGCDQNAAGLQVIKAVLHL